MKSVKANQDGFTLVEIMIVVAIIGLLAAIAVPSYVRARTSSQANACINNLRQIDGAAQTWALENNKTSTSTYTLANVTNYVKLTSSGTLPACPAGGNYSPGTTIAVPPTCDVPGHVMP